MITYNTVNAKLPAVRKKDVSAWVKKVAEKYGKTTGDIAYAKLCVLLYIKKQVRKL